MPYPISSSSLFLGLQQSISKLQTELGDLSTELSTGTYADVGVSLGSETGTLVSFQSENTILQSMTQTNTLASTRLGTTQTILQNVQASAQSLLNALLANDGSKKDPGAIVATAKSDLAAMISSLDTSSQGDYIFGGTNTSEAPIADYFGAGATNKQAVDSAFLRAFGMAQTSPDVSSISGADMQKFLDTQFAALFRGTGWSTNWSSATEAGLTQEIDTRQQVETSISANATPFKQLAEAYTMVADLGTANLGKDAFAAVTGTAQKLLTSAISGLTDTSARVGIAQASITDANNRISARTNLLSSQIGALENVNTYDVASRISQLQTQIETSYSLTSQIHALSLVNYL